MESVDCIQQLTHDPDLGLQDESSSTVAPACTDKLTQPSTGIDAAVAITRGLNRLSAGSNRLKSAGT